MSRTLKIPREVVDKIIFRAKNELPDEACGYLLGKEDTVEAEYVMTNADHSPEHFSFLPQEQFAAVRYARSLNLSVIANWHSHPSSPSRPSQEDIRLAYDSEIAYFILSLASDPPVLNAFAIKDAKVEKLTLNII